MDNVNIGLLVMSLLIFVALGLVFTTSVYVLGAVFGKASMKTFGKNVSVNLLTVGLALIFGAVFITAT